MKQFYSTNYRRDLNWFQAFSGGDPVAYEALYKAYIAQVRFFILEIGIPPRLIKDLAQQSFEKLWAYHDGFKTPRHIIDALFVIAYHLAFDFDRYHPSSTTFLDPDNARLFLRAPAIEAAFIRSEILTAVFMRMNEGGS